MGLTTASMHDAGEEKPGWLRERLLEASAQLVTRAGKLACIRLANRPRKPKVDGARLAAAIEAVPGEFKAVGRLGPGGRGEHGQRKRYRHDQQDKFLT